MATVTHESNTKHAQIENQIPSAGLTPDQAREMLGGDEVISRATFYAAISRNQIPHIRLGRRRIIIPRAAFLRWLETAGQVTNGVPPQVRA